MSHIQVFANPEALAQGAAELFVQVAREAITARGRFAVALSGGSTPRIMHTRLAADPLRGQVDWSAVHVFWGDERCVPPDHADSNYRMAQETLLDAVPIPADQVHRMRGELPALTAAAEYEKILKGFFTGTDWPRFDLVFLGMGDDGHTASLFPGTIALAETSHWVAANYVDKLHTWRVTLSAPAINAAATVAFLVAGVNKADRLYDVLRGSHQPIVLPSQLIRPTQGALLWLVDEPAAAKVT